MSRIWAADSAPTLADVALAAGVSTATASRALNGSDRRVADASRKKVEAAARWLGYTPHALAQATVRGASSLISLIVSDLADPYFGQIAAGVTHAAEKAGFIVSVAITERDPDRELRVIRALRGQRPRVVIVAESRTTDAEGRAVQREIDALERWGSRVVIIGTGLRDRPAVAIDNRGGAEALGRAMARLGYRRAIVLAATSGIATSDDREGGFGEGFVQGGGAVIAVHRGEFSRDSGAALMSHELAGGVAGGTLVFAVSDSMAIGAMAAVRGAGREVGTDVAICGFGDTPVNQDLMPGLTTVRIPLTALGRLAVCAGLEQHWPADSPSLPFDVVVRGSTPRVMPLPGIRGLPNTAGSGGELDHLHA